MARHRRGRAGSAGRQSGRGARSAGAEARARRRANRHRRPRLPRLGTGARALWGGHEAVPTGPARAARRRGQGRAVSDRRRRTGLRGLGAEGRDGGLHAPGVGAGPLDGELDPRLGRVRRCRRDAQRAPGAADAEAGVGRPCQAGRRIGRAAAHRALGGPRRALDGRRAVRDGPQGRRARLRRRAAGAGVRRVRGAIPLRTQGRVCVAGAPVAWDADRHRDRGVRLRRSDRGPRPADARPPRGLDAAAHRLGHRRGRGAHAAVPAGRLRRPRRLEAESRGGSRPRRRRGQGAAVVGAREEPRAAVADGAGGQVGRLRGRHRRVGRRRARRGPHDGADAAVGRLVAADDGAQRLAQGRRGHRGGPAAERAPHALVPRHRRRLLALLDPRARRGPPAHLRPPRVGPLRRAPAGRGPGPIRLHRPRSLQGLDPRLARHRRRQGIPRRLLLARARRAAPQGPRAPPRPRLPQDVVPLQRQGRGRGPPRRAGHQAAQEALRRKQLPPGRALRLPQIAVLRLRQPCRGRARLPRAAGRLAAGAPSSRGALRPRIQRPRPQPPRLGRAPRQQQHDHQPHAGAHLLRRPPARPSALPLLDGQGAGLRRVQARDPDGPVRHLGRLPHLPALQPDPHAQHHAEHPAQPRHRRPRRHPPSGQHPALPRQPHDARPPLRRPPHPARHGQLGQPGRERVGLRHGRRRRPRPRARRLAPLRQPPRQRRHAPRARAELPRQAHTPSALLSARRAREPRAADHGLLPRLWRDVPRPLRHPRRDGHAVPRRDELVALGHRRAQPRALRQGRAPVAGDGLPVLLRPRDPGQRHLPQPRESGPPRPPGGLRAGRRRRRRLRLRPLGRLRRGRSLLPARAVQGRQGRDALAPPRALPHEPRARGHELLRPARHIPLRLRSGQARRREPAEVVDVAEPRHGRPHRSRRQGI